MEVFEANSGADAPACLLKVYEGCRCSLCRCGAVDVLLTVHAVPPWMAAECRHDSNPHVREAFAEPTANEGA